MVPEILSYWYTVKTLTYRAITLRKSCSDRLIAELHPRAKRASVDGAP